MNESATITTELDRLAERVERAAGIVEQLRAERAQLAKERDALTVRLQELERQLQGQDATRLLDELATLRGEQRDWNAERRDVATRIETLLKKLDRLES
jgi:chromosome segregation ATPase